MTCCCGVSTKLFRVTHGILDSIDGALYDFETSKDAMRWVPEDERHAGNRPAAVSPWHDLAGAALVLNSPSATALMLTVDADEFNQALNELAAAVTRAFRPVIEDTVKAFHGLSAVLSPELHRKCWTCHPKRKPKPLAVDGHEYQRRLRARRKRKRR